MNPLDRVSPDIHDLVLQHFNAKEVLEYSLISTKFNETIAGTSCCMKKIEFVLKFWKKSAGLKQEQIEEKISVIHSSIRKYQSVAIDCRFDKNLSLEFWKLLEVLARFVTELKIKSIQLDSPSSISLPRLQTLKLTYVPVAVRNVLISQTRALRKLKLKLESPLKWSKPRSDQESLTCIRNCLKQNQMLQELELHGASQYHFLFDDDMSEVLSFQLLSLKVKTDTRLALISEENERNFLSFLTTQSTFLKSFFIDVCRPVVIQHIFNKMPALTNLTLDVMIMNEYKIRDLNLQLNENITDLKIPYINDHQDIKEFLSVVPNLKSLFVAHLSHETVEYIAWNLNKLTTLKFRYDEIDCEGFYERLRDDSPYVNQNIDMIVDYEYT